MHPVLIVLAFEVGVAYTTVWEDIASGHYLRALITAVILLASWLGIFSNRLTRR
jgi:hypothetical protein